MNGNILITGGTGTIGNAIVTTAKREKWDATFTIFSRSEFLQSQMRAKHPDLNYVLGDVRDKTAVSNAVAGHNIVIHAAAMKRIPECEAQPDECYKTNVIGSLNVVTACLSHNVTKCIGLSTDKACQPVTAYGASKLMMERIFTSQPHNQSCDFTIVRYGNVLQSRGSVIPIWREQHAQGAPLTVTDLEMTRFWITPLTAVSWIKRAHEMPHGWIYVPKMDALPIIEMADIIAPGATLKEVGLRSQERLHEYLIAPDETATEYPDHYIIHNNGDMGHVYDSKHAPQIPRHKFNGMLTEVETCI